MASQEILRQLSESLGATATVNSVFGEPIHAQGRTVIPVARVAYGFGGGFGSGQGPRLRAAAADAGPTDDGTTDARVQGEGGGAGGGLQAYPVGALEISADGTRFIAFPDLRWLALAFGAGAAIGGWWFARKARR